MVAARALTPFFALELECALAFPTALGLELLSPSSSHVVFYSFFDATFCSSVCGRGMTSFDLLARAEIAFIALHDSGSCVRPWCSGRERMHSRNIYMLSLMFAPFFFLLLSPSIGL